MKNTTILYFTGTGNSLFVAKKIKEFSEDYVLMDICKAIKENIYDFSESDVIFCFPCYAFGLPLIVKEFLEKANFSVKSFLCAVSTAGGGKSMPVNYNIEKCLNKSGISLSSSYVIQMPSNYIPLGGAKAENVQEKMFKNADLKISNIKEAILNKKSGSFENGNFIWKMLLNIALKFFYKGIETGIDKKYKVKENCTSCGICEKICPVQNISLKDGKPVWNGKCQMCMACLQFCPVEAIEYGNSEGKKRYSHPQITAQDIIKNR